MNIRNLAIALVLALCVLISSGSSIEDETIFRALSDELSRSLLLSMESAESPYFVQYRIMRGGYSSFCATNGGLTQSFSDTLSRLSVEVRTGDYSFDNTGFNTDNLWKINRSFNLTEDVGYETMRYRLWLSTDAVYKTVLEQFSKKKAAIEQSGEPQPYRDFTREKSITFISDILNPDLVERDLAEDYVKRLSLSLAKNKAIERSSFSLTQSWKDQYLANTENTKIKTSSSYSRVFPVASCRSKDGRFYIDYRSIWFETGKLPDVSVIERELVRMTEDLEKTSKGDTLDYYFGPVIMKEQAAAALFIQTFSSRASSPYQFISDTRRSSIFQNLRTDTYENKINRRVMPDFLSITDDPLIETHNGQILTGHYLFDDEGVTAKSVNIVEDGF
jgi:predicted Zn-dependent protease